MSESMNSVTYLLLAACVTLLVLATTTIGTDNTHRRTRLERKLHKRLERGTDRYFEELRDIQSALAMEKAPEPGAVAVAEEEQSDLDRFILWFGLLLVAVWGLSLLPIERIGLTAPGWVSYAGAVGVAMAAYRELNTARKRTDDDAAGRLFFASIGCLWAAMHIHDLLEGKLW